MHNPVICRRSVHDRTFPRMLPSSTYKCDLNTSDFQCRKIGSKQSGSVGDDLLLCVYFQFEVHFLGKQASTAHRSVYTRMT
uniref:Uncharacterized protein n=1 Tax=Ciona intestinalis TaxID=7719 RepID=H2XVQ3_CIOIN